MARHQDVYGRERVSTGDLQIRRSRQRILSLRGVVPLVYVVIAPPRFLTELRLSRPAESPPAYMARPQS